MGTCENCGRTSDTPYCGFCGTRVKPSGPIEELLGYLRDREATYLTKAARSKDGFQKKQNDDTAAKFAKWADAVFQAVDTLQRVIVDSSLESTRGAGRKGGAARAAKLSPARRKAIAKKAARARWGPAGRPVIRNGALIG